MVRMMDFAKVIQSSAVWAEGALVSKKEKKMGPVI